MSLLEVAGLRKAFGGVVAVDDLSFALDAGRMLAMIGPNGAGKSTCFAMLGGQLRPDRGSVRLDGRAVTGWPARRIWRAGVGRTFQVTRTFGSMSVFDNVQTVVLSHRRRLRSLLRSARGLYREEVEALLDGIARFGKPSAVGHPFYRLFLRVPIAGIYALKEEHHGWICGTAPWSLLRGYLPGS